MAGSSWIVSLTFASVMVRYILDLSERAAVVAQYAVGSEIAVRYIFTRGDQAGQSRSPGSEWILGR